MAKLSVSRNVMEKARERSILSGDERATVDQVINNGKKGAIATQVSELPLPFLKTLLDDAVSGGLEAITIYFD